MSERHIKETVNFVDPMCGKVNPTANKNLPDVPMNYNMRDVYGVELDKETGETKIVVTGQTDQDKEIQEYKDDCGFEGMRKLLATGQAVPSDFADDGKHGLDVTGIPDNVHDAYRAAMAGNSDVSKMLDSLGIKLEPGDTQETIEKKITDAVKAQMEAATAKATVEVNANETK